MGPVSPNPWLVDAGRAANCRRASKVGRRQAVLARHALTVMEASSRPATQQQQRWIQALRHRADHPDTTLRVLAETMTPPMTKNAYAALLRRALRAGTAGMEGVS